MKDLPETALTAATPVSRGQLPGVGAVSGALPPPFHDPDVDGPTCALYLGEPVVWRKLSPLGCRGQY